MRIQVWDEAIPGRRAPVEPFTLRNSTTTPRELIRTRVQQEVERHNESMPDVFRGLVQPEESEQVLNGFRLRLGRRLDWEAQFRRACSSFEKNGFLLIVDGRQVTELDEPVDLHEDSEVQFVKLVPLVGG